ncbi:unnamed protein product [Macrosiphum euphorbiae]|uniref:Uncharacterized protein n=1 Tax=Macrosiphum euphorbiae TaxID=13131 RepID=A0AAV0XTG9_9HEMI|nr:unnamed protein product [Macrosiphum euphorbiae]
MIFLPSLETADREKIMDIDQLLSERVLELFGLETLELDNQYQVDISLQHIQPVASEYVDQKEQLKAQAKYRREADAKLTKYSLEPTFYMPSTIRATPITYTEPEEEEPPQENQTSDQTTTSQNSQTEHQNKMSNTRKRKERYKETRRNIRKQRKEEKSAKHPPTT